MAVEGVRAEAIGEPQTITFRTLKLTIQPPDEWLFDFLNYTDRDQMTLALEAMLGTEQYEALRALKPRPKMSELNGLMSTATSAFGLDDAGN